MEHLVVLFLCMVVVNVNTLQYMNNKLNTQYLCPQLYPRIFHGYSPKKNLTAGTYKEIQDAHSPEDCVYKCCENEDCNVAFMTNSKCFHIVCVSNEFCLPVMSKIDEVTMVLVRPTPGQDSWSDVLHEQEMATDHIGREMYNYVNRPRFEDTYKDLIQLNDKLGYTGCAVGVPNSCGLNEECIANNQKSRAGTCKCKLDFVRSREGICEISLLGLKDAAIEGMLSEDNAMNLTVTTKRPLTVQVESKEIKLPENEVSLTAVVSPQVSNNEKYNYAWTSLRKPEGSSAVKKQTGEVLHLSKLTEGLYTFKVNVSSEVAYGETFVNVTVLPPSRINRPPHIVITPANQTIKLPNTGAVLDASSSTDDDGIVSYHWELQEGPVGYQPQLVDAQTLELKDLSRPGNYTFKLTVTDTDKATSSSTANITILKITDYPPEANAGEDKIIYLPHNKITLNGNLSTDDHLITTWEWTKSPDDADKAVDMQDTRTPFLRLSDLEEGIYTFQLKVTDSTNQSSVASVHVFVKPPTNQPPIAKTGDNITISLPQTWIVVDASNSTDDNKIISYKWEKVEGPSNVVFLNGNSSRTNVTSLTKGNYVFKVSVTDDNNNVATALQYVLVNQNKNQKPIANAGGNFEVELPRSVLYVNGSKSSDDWAIVKWKWIRVDSSLAYGNIGEHSDESPVLIVADVIPGKYVFNLTVFDEQGLSDTDTAVVMVKQDANLYYLVDMLIEANVGQFAYLQYTTLTNKLALLVQDNSKLIVRDLISEAGTDRAIIRFYVQDIDGNPLGANGVVEQLRKKLKVDGSLLGFSVNSLKTTICQNNCSNHGVCDEKTRQCICEAFWMTDMFKVYLGDDSDCSWSILYVVLGVLCTVVVLVGAIWGAIYFCFNCCSCKNNKPTNYKLIENTEDLPPYYPRKDISDTDSDSDVVFESRNKSRFSSESRNGHKQNRNGFNKVGRRVKT